jgi:hypothetical protein
VKLKVSCPICHAQGELDVPDEAWERVEGTNMTGRVVEGKICPHEFRVEFSRAGLVLGYQIDEEAEEPQLRAVKFNVKTAIRNLGNDILAALLTAGVSEQTIVLRGSLPVTAGIRSFLERVLPDSVDVGACVYMVTKEEYTSLPDSVKQHMTVDVASKTVTNSAFDEDQLAWIKKVLIRANMLANQEDAENLILQETSKLRTTVSLLRHLAARRRAGCETRKQEGSE